PAFRDVAVHEPRGDVELCREHVGGVHVQSSDVVGTAVARNEWGGANMKSLCVAVLSGLLILGVSASVIAQQSGASSSAQSEATKPADDKATSSSSSSSSAAKPDQSAPGASSMPAPDRSSSSSSTSVDILKSEPRTDVG